MNKKTLFSILLVAVILPMAVYAINEPSVIFDKTKDLAVSLGTAIVVIGWIIAGILYLTATGKPEKINTAKGAMIAAIIGTVLVVIAALGYDVIKGLLTPIIGS